MKFFRIHTDDGLPSVWKLVVLAVVILLVVGSFLLQISLGVCPVP